MSSCFRPTVSIISLSSEYSCVDIAVLPILQKMPFALSKLAVVALNFWRVAGSDTHDSAPDTPARCPTASSPESDARPPSTGDPTCFAMAGASRLIDREKASYWAGLEDRNLVASRGATHSPDHTPISDPITDLRAFVINPTSERHRASIPNIPHLPRGVRVFRGDTTITDTNRSHLAEGTP